jgi:two-component system, cell cycle response regulator
VTILIVDDNDEYRPVLRMSLEREGHAVVEAADCASALEALRGHAVGLIISDLDMPGCSGRDFHGLVRADPDLRHLPFIYLTGYGEARVAIAPELGFLDFLESKVPIRHLMDTVRKLSRASQ